MKTSLVHAALVLAFVVPVAAAESSLPVVAVVWQPFSAGVKRLIEAMDYQGAPLPAADVTKLNQLLGESNLSADSVQAILDAHCLFFVNINAEMRVKVFPGSARPELTEQGWRLFLVKVQNEAGTTAPLRITSTNASSLKNSPASAVADKWLDLQTDAHPLKPALSGAELEYRIVHLYSRDTGKREAKFSFDVGQGTQDVGFRGETDILFTVVPSHEIILRVRDERDIPTTAAFTIRDRLGRVYPSPAKRLAPDFAFQPQIYRADGEAIKLPDGDFTIGFSRGPESIIQTRTVTVTGTTRQLDFKVQRWVDPAQFGWWSGDHHIHAAGCAHYKKPTEGVMAGDMMRHILGEDLKVGCSLTWGPCFDFQKQFFTGKDDKVSNWPYLLHYDIEVSQFGSHKSGHLCLLRLREQIYPGGDSTAHWPTLGLNTLRWAKKQGAVCGPAHSGSGIDSGTADLPNYIVPPFNGIGADEYIVDVTHEVEGPDGKLVPAIDFMSTVDTPYVSELNMWYHTLNCGFRTRISGETDFPCIYDERVGMGRSYVKQEKLSYHDWCQGIREGRCYVSDGKSHLIDFKVNNRVLGENGSELELGSPSKIHVTARVAALLDEKADSGIQKRSYQQKPYWSIERARIKDSCEVPVELIVNGQPVARKNIPADGSLREIAFDASIERSSWVALRILASSHTNPIFILVDGKPIRASRRSADWCLKGVDQCWSQKKQFINPAEMNDAVAAYDHARGVYRRLLSESPVE